MIPSEVAGLHHLTSSRMNLLWRCTPARVVHAMAAFQREEIIRNAPAAEIPCPNA